jgi:hypothetical protein
MVGEAKSDSRPANQRVLEKPQGSVNLRAAQNKSRRALGRETAAGQAECSAMVTRTYEAIYLGTFAALDPDDSDFVAENAGLFVGTTFGSSGAPLFGAILPVTIDDADGSGAVGEDRGNGEPLSYDLGAGPVSALLASTQIYNVTLTYAPSSGLPPATVYMVTVQDALGNVFVLPPHRDDPNVAAFEAGPIESITVNSLRSTRLTGLVTDRVDWDLVVCFARGTLIGTPAGERAVETLGPGDLVLTLDRGPAALRWVASRLVPAMGRFAPVVFEQGAIGNRRRLVVSPQHRMLVRGAKVELLFGQEEVLAPARSLVDGDRVWVREGGEVEYFHLLFDRHEIVFAEGVPAESLFVSRESLRGLGHEGYAELAALFPELVLRPEAWGALSRPVLRGREARLLA